MVKHVLAGLVALVAVVSGANMALAQSEWGWSPLRSGVGGSEWDKVRALTVFDDGKGPALYAAGEFTEAGGVSAKNIAKWDGVAWSPLGSGMNERVWALSTFDDGAGEALYAGGYFTVAGGISANYIAKWDGTRWSRLGSGMGQGQQVRALTVFDDGRGPALYAGGLFNVAGGVTVNKIAKWDGANWSPLGDGMNDPVYALAVFDDLSGPALYAGGMFSKAGVLSANHIAKWDGWTWSALRTGLNNGVMALTPFDDGSGSALYVGGIFSEAGSVEAKFIAKWSGWNWSSVGGGMGPLPGCVVRDLVAFDDGRGPALYAGGGFPEAGVVTVNHIAKWDGASWSPLGSGMGGPYPHVYALAVFDDGRGPALYAGGRFTEAGGVSAINVAKWSCEVLGDLNCDGALNFDDIDPFVLALGGQVGYYAKLPRCRWLNADCNRDGTVDFDDIDPFVALLGGG